MKNTEKYYNINKQIKSPKVRIVGDNIESKIVNIDEALKIAENKGMDLVEISSNINPPVCKIIDYQKFQFEKKLKEKELKKNQRKNTNKIKEIRLSYNIDDNDFNFKLNHAKNFLEKGNKVKVSIFFKGREINYKSQGELLLLKFITKLDAISKAEFLPKTEGKKIWTILNKK